MGPVWAPLVWGMQYAVEMAKEAKSKLRQFQVFLVDLVLTVAGVGLVVLGARAVWLENLGIAGTALGAGLVLLFAATVHRFEYLKGLGIEARTRELDQAIGKAEVTLAQVKALAELTGANLVLLYNSVGRWGNAPTAEVAYAQSRKVKSMLTALGSDEKTINEALEPWARTAAYDLLQLRHQDIFGHISLQKQCLSEQARDAQGPTKTQLERRIQALSDYTLPDMGNLINWQISSFAARLTNYLSNIPESLDPDVTAELKAAIAKDEIEFTALDQRRDIVDAAYWARQPFTS